MEVVQRLIDASTSAVSSLHPAYLVQHMHAVCSRNSHRQPLLNGPSILTGGML
jgi:hypothetical protein